MQLHALRDRLRPGSLDDVVGNRQAVEILRGMIANKHYEHVLFHGPVGTGKSTLAEIVRREMIDPYWRSFLKPRMNSSQYSGVEFIRELLTYSAIVGVKPFILDECHALSRQAQTALLSAMEDPTSNCLFFFCTTEPLKLLAALRRRCRKIQLQPLAPTERVELIARGWKMLRGDMPVPEDFVNAIQTAGLDSPALIFNALDEFASGAPATEAVESAQFDVEFAPTPRRRLGGREPIINLPDVVVRRAAEMYKAGKPWEEIKRAFGLKHSHGLRTAMRRLGLYVERPGVKRAQAKRRKVDPERALEMRQQGMTLREIGQHFGVTPPSVLAAIRNTRADS